jgi:hypothetical protein
MLQVGATQISQPTNQTTNQPTKPTKEKVKLFLALIN